jgi:DNA-binding LytR/AlgR family response regulator
MLQIADLLYIEAVGNYVKIYQLSENGVQSSMLRATSKQMEDDLRDYPMIVRCHRAFLVNLRQVEEIVSRSGSMQLLIKHSHDALPVSRSNMAQVKAAINSL